LLKPLHTKTKQRSAIMATANLNRVSSPFQSSTQNAAGLDREPFAGTNSIFIIGEQNLAVTGLASMLGAQEGNELVACTELDRGCLEKLAALRPDALLIQQQSLPQAFDEFIHDVHYRVPGIKVLLFGSTMDDQGYLYHLVRAGVQGYINEHADIEHIQRALREVLQGNNWIERRILQRFVVEQQDFDEQLEAEFNARIEQFSDQLTRRELEILNEVVKGLAIKQIAERVHLSHQGVKMHLAKLFKKFGVSNRNQLIIAAFDAMSPVEDLSALLQRGLSTQLLRKHQRHGL
jgi:DNA-binding NarL/FixJ family response regulator